MLFYYGKKNYLKNYLFFIFRTEINNKNLNFNINELIYGRLLLKKNCYCKLIISFFGIKNIFQSFEKNF